MSLAELHAALNDFPVALLVASVGFDLAASGPRRASLQSAAYWSLIAGAAAAILAVVTGLIAATRVESKPALDQILQTHRALGIALALLFAGLAAWRIWRKNTFSVPEQQSYIMAAVVGALILLWTAHLGGTMVFRQGAGVEARAEQR